MQIILSPAKKLRLTKSCTDTSTIPYFNDDAEKVMSVLKLESIEKIEEKMKISHDLAVENHQRYKIWDKNISKNHINAGFLYDGATFQGLDINSFDDNDMSFAQSHLFVVSALYGLLRPLDAVMPYRLEMQQRNIIVDDCKNLYEFWKNKITDLLNIKLDEDNILVNLASDEYFKAIDKKKFKGRFITPIFYENKNGKYKIISSYVKKARGSFAKYIIKNKISSLDKLCEFDYDGYKFDSFDNDIMIFKRG